jgi:ribosomal protein L16 Arg81 hydroxylase
MHLLHTEFIVSSSLTIATISINRVTTLKEIKMNIPQNVINEIKLTKPAFFKGVFDKFFTWKDLENLLNLRPFVNADRCKIINQKTYNWQRQTWMSDVNTFPPSILDTEIRQFHCYLSDASRANEKTNAICAELEQTFSGGASDAHIYFNLAETPDNGFGIHWDFSHNLIVQMEGQSKFQVWDDTVVGDRNVTFLSEQPIIDVVMEPGDAVFVPLNVYHQATSMSKRLSISFPISFNNETATQERHWIKIT